ncbi:MAG TPA: alpha/beta fold hydrolase [Vicinamibacteria bacterium]|nr:alpha/beta fold hydrolase [Vicinamibacteria bacterium]
MTTQRRRWAASLFVFLAGLLGFAYARPVTVLESWGALRLRLAGVRSAEVQAGPYRLHYLEAGAGPPLVLVHGLGSSAAQDWGRLIAPLGRTFHVWAPDLPGFGRSERPRAADYSVSMQVEAVRAFMQALGVGRARVAGISMGGWIVSRLAGEHPGMVERLVVVAAAGMRPEPNDIPVEVLLPKDEAGVRRLVAAVRHNAPIPPAFVARDILARRLEEEWVVRRALESMGAGRDWLDGTLGRADMPVLVVWGREDRLIPVSHAPRLEAEFPRATLRVLDGCGHVPMADCPEAFDREVIPFLAAGDASKGP